MGRRAKIEIWRVCLGLRDLRRSRKRPQGALAQEVTWQMIRVYMCISQRAAVCVSGAPFSGEVQRPLTDTNGE